MAELLDLSSVRRVLIIHAGALGDCVLTLHLAGRVGALLPAARIEMAARSPVAAFAAGRGPIHKAWSLEHFGLHHFHGTSSVPTEFINKLQPFDLVLSFLAGSEAHVSRRLAAQVSYPAISVDPAPRAHSPARHITAQWSSDLKRAGFSDLPRNHQSPFIVTPPERIAARERLADITGVQPGHTVLCHPGAGGRAKCCPLGVLEAATSRLRDAGATTLWMIGPTEIDWHGSEYRTRLARTAPVVFSEESIDDAARLLIGADAFIGNDAGMTHVAAALGVPTTALFGPTDPNRWAPLGPAVSVLRFEPSVDEEELARQIASGMHDEGAVNCPRRRSNSP